jgi:hypothetical protein
MPPLYALGTVGWVELAAGSPVGGGFRLEKPAARRERGTIADFDGVRNMSERLTTCVVTYLDSSAAVRSSPSAVAIRLRRLRLPYEGRLSMSGNRGLGELQCGGSWVSSWCFSSPSYGGRRRSGSRNIERVTV